MTSDPQITLRFRVVINYVKIKDLEAMFGLRERSIIADTHKLSGGESENVQR